MLFNNRSHFVCIILFNAFVPIKDTDIGEMFCFLFENSCCLSAEVQELAEVIIPILFFYLAEAERHCMA